jgi:hypothetical protein
VPYDDSDRSARLDPPRVRHPLLERLLAAPSHLVRTPTLSPRPCRCRCRAPPQQVEEQQQEQRHGERRGPPAHPIPVPLHVQGTRYCVHSFPHALWRQIAAVNLPVTPESYPVIGLVLFPLDIDIDILDAFSTEYQKRTKSQAQSQGYLRVHWAKVVLARCGAGGVSATTWASVATRRVNRGGAPT